MIGIKGKEDREETLGIIHNFFCFFAPLCKTCEKHVKRQQKSDLRGSVIPMHPILGVQ